MQDDPRPVKMLRGVKIIHLEDATPFVAEIATESFQIMNKRLREIPLANPSISLEVESVSSAPGKV